MAVTFLRKLNESSSRKSSEIRLDEFLEDIAKEELETLRKCAKDLELSILPGREGWSVTISSHRTMRVEVLCRMSSSKKEMREKLVGLGFKDLYDDIKGLSKIGDPLISPDGVFSIYLLDKYTLALGYYNGFKYGSVPISEEDYEEYMRIVKDYFDEHPHKRRYY